jgi:phage shock protein PspC (stress-responsive transcriptional regulator)
MNRSFSNRIFGGVCGALGKATPLNAWLWRILFIILTALTMGAAAIAYILLWWILPLDSPLRRDSGSALLGLIAFLLSSALIVAWFLRDTLGLTENYWIVAALLLAGVFLLKQIFTRRWQNIVLGLVALVVPIFFLLENLGQLSGGLTDITLRSSPAILIFLGLWIALRYRVPFSSLIALIISVGLVAGMSFYAFNSRIDVPADNNRVEIAVPNQDEYDLAEISANVTTLAIDITTLDTDVTISAGDDNRVISGEFVGSRNSDIQITYNETGDIASMQLSEVSVDEFPNLEDIGRGELVLQIPPNIAVGVTFKGQRAQELTLDMAALNLELLFFEVNQGNVLVVLPEYQALSPSVQESNGHWQVMNGNLRVEVPDAVGARFLLNENLNPRPAAGQTYDDLIYRLEFEIPDLVLVSRQFESQDIKVNYRIDVPVGSLRIESGGG